MHTEANMLEILVRILDDLQSQNFLDTQCDELAQNMSSAGFSDDEIVRMKECLTKIKQLQAITQRSMPSGGFPMRIYTSDEQQKLPTDCRGFLLKLECSGMVPPELREVIIEQAMRLDEVEFDLPRFRMFVLLMLFNQRGLDYLIDGYQQSEIVEGII